MRERVLTKELLRMMLYGMVEAIKRIIRAALIIMYLKTKWKMYNDVDEALVYCISSSTHRITLHRIEGREKSFQEEKILLNRARKWYLNVIKN
jgi:hypothetical protein